MQTKPLTATQAGRRLGVTESRVIQLIEQGALIGWKGKVRNRGQLRWLVDGNSVQARLEEKGRAKRRKVKRSPKTRRHTQITAVPTRLTFIAEEDVERIAERVYAKLVADATPRWWRRLRGK